MLHFGLKLSSTVNKLSIKVEVLISLLLISRTFFKGRQQWLGGVNKNILVAHLITKHTEGWNFTLIITNACVCNSTKYPDLPNSGDFFLTPPSLPRALWKFQFIFIHFQSLLWGNSGHFLELYNCNKYIISNTLFYNASKVKHKLSWPLPLCFTKAKSDNWLPSLNCFIIVCPIIHNIPDICLEMDISW